MLLEGESQRVLQGTSRIYGTGLAKGTSGGNGHRYDFGGSVRSCDSLSHPGDNIIGWTARRAIGPVSTSAEERSGWIISRAFQVRAVKVGVVEEIEEVHAELDSVLLLDVPVLCQLAVEVGVGCALA